MSTETLSASTDHPEALPLKPPNALPPQRNSQSVFLRNSVSNLIRLGITAVVSILLPTFLTHHLSVTVYGAWVLILQLSAYVAFLNLGVQTAVSKYIAEYEARQDFLGAGKAASAGLRMMFAAGSVGALLSVALALYAPRLFGNMPPDLLRDVRISIVVVGASLSIGLVSSIFSAIFLGLRRYEVPMVVNIANRLLYGAAVVAVVSLHRGLLVMAVVTALINLLTSAAEVAAWRWGASIVPVRLRGVDTDTMRQMIAYCSILTIWSICMLFISGLDVTIVGHFAFDKVAFYSIAVAPTNMILLLVGALLGPLLPATSAMSVSSSPDQMGAFLLKSTRYSTILLLATGLPMLVAGFPILRLWVGRNYALNSILFLHLLLIANMIRNLGAPYSTMVVATSRQRFGTPSALAEGVVNLASSVLLAHRIGAVGVALGTLIGSIVGLALHFAVTMHYTRADFSISRAKLFLAGILKPSVMALPTALLAGRWWVAGFPAISAPLWTLWAVSTALLAWFLSLEAEDRVMLLRLVCSRSL